LSSGGHLRSRRDPRGHATKTVRDREAPGSNPGPRPIFEYNLMEPDRSGGRRPHQAMSSCLTGLCGAAIDAPTPSRWSGQRRRRGVATRMIRPREEITDIGGRRQIVGSRGCVQPFDIDGSSKPGRDREFGQRDPSDWTRTHRSSGGGTELSGGF